MSKGGHCAANAPHLPAADTKRLAADDISKSDSQQAYVNLCIHRTGNTAGTSTAAAHAKLGLLQ